MARPELLIVAAADDRLAATVRGIVSSLGGAVTWYRPDRLGEVGVSLCRDGFIADGRRVRTVLWRVSPEMPLAEVFRAEDRTFATAEIAATWIAALAAPGVTAVNRFDANAWYSGLRPYYWRRLLRSAGLAVAPTRVGAGPVPDDWHWSPYTTGDPEPLSEPRVRAVMAGACHPMRSVSWTISIGGKLVSRFESPNVVAAAYCLHRCGVSFAAIEADARGRVQRVRVLPVLDEASVTQEVALMLAKYLYDDCMARRP